MTTTKYSKSATKWYSAIALLLFIISGWIFPVLRASALDYSYDTNVQFALNPTLSLSLSGSLSLLGLQPGTSADSNVITIDIGTNNVTGYTLSANVGSSSYPTTSLIHNDDSNYQFSSVNSTITSLSDFNDNEWGYSYTVNTGSWSNYSGLPIYSNNTGSAVLNQTSIASEDIIGLKLGARAASNQVAGTYTNVVNFMAVTNAVPMSISDAFALAGAEQVNGYYTMQDMTSSICEAVQVYDEDSQTQLIDVRDHKVYVVTKLRDGYCWMVQNLQTDINDPNITFTNQNTNITTNPGAAEGYTTSGSTITWAPNAGKAQVVNYAAGHPANSVTGWATSDTSPYYAVPADGNEHYMVKGTHYATTAACTAALSTDECRPYNVGYYYNWSAAVASNNTSSYTSDMTVMPNSICPAGWRLPNGLTKSGGTTNPSEFNLLLNAYGLAGGTDTTGDADVGWAGGGMNAFESSPFYFARSGRVSVSTLYFFTTDAHFWSSTVYSSGNSYNHAYTSGALSSARRLSRGHGFSLRCLAK